MMTYEQFLKQLRRIGKQTMLASADTALILLVLLYKNDFLFWLTDILIYCFLAFSVGLIIYPFIGEE